MTKKISDRFPSVHQEVLVNLRKAEIQINQAIEMIKNKKDCIVLIEKSKDGQSFLKEADSLLLENHLKDCIANFDVGKNLNHCVEEIMKIFKANGGRV